MELPHLGKNCALKECNQLDFLPVKCDACSEVFCLRHYKYDTHNCERARNKDNQVPACPLCSEPVVGRRDQLPDIAVSEHIDRFCKQNELLKNRREKPKTNLQSCSFARCKQKDVIYLECNDCRSKFCIKHRHPDDHSCPGPTTTTTMANNLADGWQSFKGSCSTGATSSYEMIKNKAQLLSKSGQAALNRMSQASRTRRSGDSNNTGTRNNSSNHLNHSHLNSLQGSLSEQEALAIALNESKSTTSSGAARNGTEDEDQALARALHESQLEARRQQASSSGSSSNKDGCVLS